ncbi:MAG: helix-hairpin-helix domain-containing protein [Blastocatellia bacterium]|nr:helix-hairpin-helix domain-containing protein [Blastocatellia bacterium]MCS7158305.1 helix-hairpin-helix domain-containing protein [Blastocatellia bacterium]MCX7753143.1 helix-hairpin-helix domain-containing protein [Blastocatellia bacterium]MDW8169458.1 helix-hairpin-helix domain-containing protein [Acidobacteriota bacterium]MDW8255732.1 helix-hairpin-helix domain-containing protein [Acidobacteriota bacterium]
MGSALVLLLALALAISRFRSWREERAISQRSALIESQCAPGKVNVNRATQKELEAVPGIGPVLAQEIIRYRERHGPFRRLEELLILRGVSTRKLRALSAALCVEDGRSGNTN